MNRQGSSSSGLGVNVRGQSLVDAVYGTLGHRRVDDSGPWIG